MRANAIVAVVAVNVAAAAGLAYLWSDADRSRWAEPAALPPALEEVAAAPASDAGDVTRFRETIERPLFAANRRPAPKADPATEAQAAADSLKDIRLLGTYGSGERGGIVIVRNGKVERVAVGDSIGGWKLAGGGQGRSAELVRADGQRRELQLALNNVAPAAPAAAGKAGEDAAAAAAQAPEAAGQAPAAGASRAATSQRASTSRSASAWGRDLSPEARQQRLDELNQRRAARRQQRAQESK
jgi:hypothetical protein